MPGLLDQVTDTYAREARLTPALLAVAPLALTAVLLFPQGDLVWKAVLGLALSCGVALPLANIARDAGRRVEKRMRARQGGRSSAHMLRHADDSISPTTKSRYHAALTRAGVAVPTAEQERLDAASADQIYESAVDLLLAKRPKGETQSLEFKENVAYGYRRNTLGLKPWAIVLALLALAASVWALAGSGEITPAGAASAGASLAALGFNIIVVRPEWVLARDHDYARQLLQTCESLA